MADKHKSQVEQNAQRIAQWLAAHSTEFEQQGIYEDQVADSIGLANKDTTEAIDHLENREEVVRIPKSSTTPPQFLLKPGRGWADVRDKVLEKSAGA